MSASSRHHAMATACPTRPHAVSPAGSARAAALAAMLALSLMLVAGFSRPAAAADISHPDAVVELFTSQGCSSCPPADAALREMVEAGGILGLAFHVDYWNGHGWKDTFSSEEYTRRQWAYAHALGERQVYTPQAIVNGRSHHIGSRKQRILDRVGEFTGTTNGLTIPIRATAQDGILTVEIDENPGSAHATLYAVYFEPRASVDIRRGENRGRTLDYTNIVRKVEMIGMAGSDGLKAEFSLSDLSAKGYGGCALILQGKIEGGHPGPILGAVSITGL